MRHALAALLMLALLTPKAPQQDGREPERMYRIEIDGQAFAARVDEPLFASVGEASAWLVLRRAGTRLFALERLELAYPEWMAFRVELESAEEERWALTGQDVSLTISRHVTPRRSARDFLEQLADDLQLRSGERIEWQHLTLAGESRTGRAVRASEDGRVVQRRVFTLSHGEDVYVLTVAENLDRNGRSLAEARDLLQLLTDTLRLK